MTMVSRVVEEKPDLAERWKDEEKPALAQPWKEWLGHVGALLTAAGIVVYGLVSQAYGVFYGALGVDAQDVGLSYAATLIRSIKFIVMLTAALYLCIPLLPLGLLAFGLIRKLFGVIWQALDPVGHLRRGLRLHLWMYRDLRADLREKLGTRWWWRRRKDPEAAAIIERRLAQADGDLDALQSSLEEEFKRREELLDNWLRDLRQDLRELDPVGTFISTLVATCLLLIVLVFPFAQADRDARAVLAGHAIRAPGLLDPFNPLSIRAELARVRPAGKPGEAPEVDRLSTMSLIYLGKADGMAVFYDPVRKSAKYVPVSSVIVDLLSPSDSADRARAAVKPGYCRSDALARPAHPAACTALRRL